MLYIIYQEDGPDSQVLREAHKLGQRELDELVRATEGLSSADVTTLCRDFAKSRGIWKFREIAPVF